MRFLFLVVGDPDPQLLDAVGARIRSFLPAAFVRAHRGKPGLRPCRQRGAATRRGRQRVLPALSRRRRAGARRRPDAGRGAVPVERRHRRSEAGRVGSSRAVLQHVGFGLDRFGEIDPIVEPGEVDQEQHDAVRDVFALPVGVPARARRPVPRACGGFDPGRQLPRRRRRPVLAGPPSAALVWWSPRRPGCATSRAARGAAPRPEPRDAAGPAPHAVPSPRSPAARACRCCPIVLTLVTLAQFVVGLFTGQAAARRWSSLAGARRPDPAHSAAARPPARPSPRPAVGARSRGRSACSCGAARASPRTCVAATPGPTPPGPVAAGPARWREIGVRSAAIGWCCLLDRRRRRRPPASITGGVPQFGQFLPFDRQPAAHARQLHQSAGIRRASVARRRRPRVWP